jgi:hypothetical protein
MTIDRRALGGALATLLLLAACGGSASPTPSSAAGASSNPAASQPAASQPAESQAAEATPEATGPDVSLVPGAAGDLEAKLPSEVNGIKFVKTSFDGNSFPAGVPVGDTQMEQFLKDNGKTLQDVRVAMATPQDTSSTAASSVVMAIQVKGVDSGKLQSWATSQLGDSSATKQNVGGKDVYGASTAGMGAYFYVKDDVVYYVLSFGGTDLASGILQQLP